jgi:CDP-diacylglycerol--serine O-phosphatidyltransferase
MRRGIYILPNALTLLGMFSGFYAMVAAVKGAYPLAAWAVLVAIMFDGLDGFVARLTRSTSRFGIELDSLSDLVAFGVAPALLLYLSSLKEFGRVGCAGAFLFVACGALRLARYNVQMHSTERRYFTGLPIPGAAFTVATMVIFLHKADIHYQGSPLVLGLTYALALLMVSTLRFHGIKEIDFSRRRPFIVLVALVMVFVVVVVEPEVALFGFALLYLAASIIENIYLFKRRRTRT